jgi:hypothetical protein
MKKSGWIYAQSKSRDQPLSITNNTNNVPKIKKLEKNFNKFHHN